MFKAQGQRVSESGSHTRQGMQSARAGVACAAIAACLMGATAAKAQGANLATTAATPLHLNSAALIRAYPIFTVQGADKIGGDVAAVEVPAISTTRESLGAAMDLALSDKGITTHIRTPIKSARAVGEVRGVRGNLEQVLARLSESFDFFWAVKDGLLTIDGERPFTLVATGEASTTAETLKAILTKAGARDVRASGLPNVFFFTATPSTLDEVVQVLGVASGKPAGAGVALMHGEPIVSHTAQAQAMAAAPAVPAAALASAIVPASAQAVPAAPNAHAAPAQAVAMEQQVAVQAPRRALLSKPVAVTPAEEIAQAERLWSVNVSDRTVEGVLRRWAAVDGWALRYEFDRIPVLRPSSVVARDFISAAKQVETQLSEAGYQLELVSIGKTLRVSPGVSK